MTESTSPPTSAQSPAPEVTFDEFKKIDIRVAKVVEATRVPNSSRLLKLILDVGGQSKQCIAGIGAKYDPEQIKDKLIVVVMNMKPRSLMGLVSEVMLLAAGDGPEISAITLDRPLEAGAKVT
ncbi:MAG: methionine--tRNA ligase subunit beta [Nitrososphaerales archaeon]